MRRRWLAGVLAVCLIGGTTAGGVAVTGGDGVGNGSAAKSQYRPPKKPHKGKKTCRDLKRDHRRTERTFHRRHKRFLKKLHGRDRRRARRFFRKEERSLRERHRRAERRCRKHKGD